MTKKDPKKEKIKDSVVVRHELSEIIETSGRGIPGEKPEVPRGKPKKIETKSGESER